MSRKIVNQLKRDLGLIGHPGEIYCETMESLLDPDEPGQWLPDTAKNRELTLESLSDECSE